MLAKKIKKSDLGEFVAILARDHDIIAPVMKDGQYVFSQVDDEKKVELGFPLTVLPIKKFIYPEKESMFKIEEGRLKETVPETRQAFLGLHVCDINGLARLGLALSNDTYYRARRDNALIIGVSCTPGPACFCKSMRANELVPGTWDLYLADRGDHYLVASGSEKGRKLLNFPIFEPTEVEVDRIGIDYEEHVRADPKKVWGNILKDHENPVWEETGKRCLGCANCTVVCPLCYCYDVQDVSQVLPDPGERIRCWDSCTLVSFAKVAGGHNFRKDIKSRYRNIYTHKFRTYQDEFGVPACVGCGRCVTFCPAGIDMRETLRRVGGD